MTIAVRLHTILSVVVLCCLAACSNFTDPSKDAAKEYFMEQCIGGIEVESLSDFSRNTQINFSLVSKIKQGIEYDFYYRAEIKYLIDGPSYRKGDRRYYEGIISFEKSGEHWKPQRVTVYGQPCGY